MSWMTTQLYCVWTIPSSRRSVLLLFWCETKIWHKSSSMASSNSGPKPCETSEKSISIQGHQRNHSVWFKMLVTPRYKRQKPFPFTSSVMNLTAVRALVQLAGSAERFSHFLTHQICQYCCGDRHTHYCFWFRSEKYVGHVSTEINYN